MSEVKGQLLGIVLTIAVFGIVFGIITAAISATATHCFHVKFFIYQNLFFIII